MALTTGSAVVVASSWLLLRSRKASPSSFFKMAEPQTSTCIDSAGRTIVFASGIDLPGDGTGTILTPQRKQIFAKTNVSVAVRKRTGWNGRKLSATGPVEKMQEALKMANDMILESQRSGQGNVDTPAYEDDPLEKMRPDPRKQKRQKSQHPAASASSSQSSWQPSPWPPSHLPPAPWQQSWQQNAWPPSPLQPAWPPPQQPPAMQLVQMMLQAIGGLAQPQPMYPQQQPQFVPPMPPPMYPPTIQLLQPNMAMEKREGLEAENGEESDDEESGSSYDDDANESEAPPVPVPAKVLKPRRGTSRQKEDDLPNGLRQLPKGSRSSSHHDRSTSPLPQKKDAHPEAKESRCRTVVDKHQPIERQRRVEWNGLVA